MRLGQGIEQARVASLAMLRMALIVGLAVAGLWLALAKLHDQAAGVRVERVDIEGVPAQVFRPEGPAKGPVLVIEHGFAGSARIMDSFALSAARAGYVAVSYDSAGHGRNPAPLSGSITEIDGATVTLRRELETVMRAARGYGDGRLAVLGHSMATDIVVRAVRSQGGVDATILVSMFSREVTPATPPNLLVVTGEWEPRLRQEALWAAGLLDPSAQEGETVGFEGNWRRAAVAPHVEHVSVLFSTATMAEMVGWLDQTFGAAPQGALADRGGWIALLLLCGAVMAGQGMRLLPQVAAAPQGAGLPWRRLWWVVLVPVVVVPLGLRFVPTGFLPVLVADYLAVHFAAFGGVLALCLWRAGAPRPDWPLRALLAGLIGFALVAGLIFWPIDAYLTNFYPGPGRAVVMAAILAGTLPCFLALEWAMRGAGAGRLEGVALKAGLLVSLLIAVALDFERLMFLLIILPVVVLAFLLFGWLSARAYGATRHPFAGALMQALAFAWALGVTFPLLAG
ncbi:alpha/beta hydrolase [Pseudogemmobacter blasticus]|uniref:Alpha/beta hydrolase n=1 Tax=Fuscovulum blasticum DSM 2131 TaxID=1188250 RepID=A0A2T4JA67_FUSBL|nr:alpha/beta fold hydrolase [Fuscovulum blasticum]PTE14717.1 alpha/beta hydrolase [Fuscovulum blasticum DSM 2131]